MGPDEARVSLFKKTESLQSDNRRPEVIELVEIGAISAGSNFCYLHFPRCRWPAGQTTEVVARRAINFPRAHWSPLKSYVSLSWMYYFGK